MFLGKDGFVWWIGVVEDNADPLNLCRAKVRIFGYHPDYNSGTLPTEDLPWAVTILSTNVPDAYNKLKLGEWVFGFFLDADEAEEPAILGYIPGIPSGGNSFGRYSSTVRNFSKVTDASNSDFIINQANSTITMTSNGEINMTRGGATIKLEANGAIIMTTNNDIIVSGNGGSYGITQQFANLDRINASQNTQIEIAKTLPVASPSPSS
jgi:hypothetical protein